MTIRVAITLCIAFVPLVAVAEDADYLSYEEFISQVDAGNIKHVAFDRFSQISGTYVVDGVDRSFDSYAETGSANDVLLIRLLKQKGVVLSVDQDRRDDPLAVGILLAIMMFVVPIVTLVFVFRIHSRLNRMIDGQTPPPFDQA